MKDRDWKKLRRILWDYAEGNPFDYKHDQSVLYYKIGYAIEVIEELERKQKKEKEFLNKMLKKLK